METTFGGEVGERRPPEVTISRIPARPDDSTLAADTAGGQA